MVEFFKQPNIDWMGKAKYFYALSAVLLIAGWTSIFLSHGLRYSIDFKGGTNVDVRFAQPPNIDKLRSGLAAQGLANTEIQSIKDVGSAQSDEVLIFVDQKSTTDEARDASKTQVLNALNAMYGLSGSSKTDLNAATPASLAAFLTTHDPLAAGPAASERYQQLAKRILDYRDRVKGGVLTNMSDLPWVEASRRPLCARSRAAISWVPSRSAISKSWVPRWAPSSGCAPSGLPSSRWGACWCILPSASSGFTASRLSWLCFTTC